MDESPKSVNQSIKDTIQNCGPNPIFNLFQANYFYLEHFSGNNNFMEVYGIWNLTPCEHLAWSDVLFIHFVLGNLSSRENRPLDFPLTVTEEIEYRRAPVDKIYLL